MMFPSADEMQLPPEGEVVPLDRLSIMLSDAPHPVQSAFPVEIEENWQKSIAANPALYDGAVLLAGLMRYADGKMEITVHRARFATLIWWRKNHHLTPFVHVFCMAFPVTTDGKIVAIKMAPHTASPGRVYCAAGTFDDDDLNGSFVDYQGNMSRELREETGLEIARSQKLHAFYDTGRVVIFKKAELDIDQIQADRNICEHMIVDHEKEISGPVFIEKGQVLSESFESYMQPIINWVFDEHSRQKEE